MILGYALTGSTVAGLMQSCDTGSKMTWTPQVFDEKQARTLSAVVDRILPATDTPGAIEVGVDQFIDKILFQVFPEDIQSGFASGIDSFNAFAKSQYRKDFASLLPKEQDAVITEYENKSGPLPASMWGFSFGEVNEFPFYRMMKELALIGYFQSERISTEVLGYDPIPGPFIGCVPYSEIGRNWSE